MVVVLTGTDVLMVPDSRPVLILTQNEPLERGHAIYCGPHQQSVVGALKVSPRRPGTTKRRLIGAAFV
jgi:hypothetical protein